MHATKPSCKHGRSKIKRRLLKSHARGRFACGTLLILIENEMAAEIQTGSISGTLAIGNKVEIDNRRENQLDNIGSISAEKSPLKDQEKPE